jgi:hypothetical protein
MQLTDGFSNNKKFQIYFFGLLLFLGIFIFRHYGMSWDEGFQREGNGMLVHNYVFHNERDPYLSSAEIYHGPAIEWLLYSLERVFNFRDSREIYLFRHLTCYLFFIFSGWIFFKLVNEMYDDWKLAAFASLLYVFSPRMFADAFYNSKDVGALASYSMCMYSAILFFKKPTLKSATFHGFLSGFLIAIRITGVIMPVVTIFIFLLRYLQDRSRDKLVDILKGIAIYLTVTILFTIAFWPILWHSPIEHFKQAWIEMSKFNWLSHVTYLSEFVNTWELPWHYLPVWIGLTTPIIVLVLLFLSIIIVIVNLFRIKRIDVDKFSFTIFAFILFLAPISAVVILNSIIYDGWRHLYFINGAMIVAAIYPIYVFKKYLSDRWNRFIIPSLVICFIPVLWMMIKIHPFQNLYFNKVYYKTIGEANFQMEMDYWGLTYSKGLKYVLDTDKKKNLNIKFGNYGGNINLLLLSREERERICIVKDDSIADYFMGNYRWCRSAYSYKNEVYNVTVDGAKVLTVFKIKP